MNISKSCFHLYKLHSAYLCLLWLLKSCVLLFSSIQKVLAHSCSKKWMLKKGWRKLKAMEICGYILTPFAMGLSQSFMKSFWAFPLTPVVFGSCPVNGEPVDLYFWPQLIFIYYEWTPAVSLLSKIYCLPLNFNIFLPKGWFRLCQQFAKPAGYLIILDFRQTVSG